MRTHLLPAQGARSAADRPPSFRSEKHDMPIDLSAPPVPFSFEVYPPRSEASLAALHEAIRHLASAGPRFISVTFGAGGSTGGRSLELLRFIQSETKVSPLAHLTCVGQHLRGSERAHPGVPGCRHHQLPGTAGRPAGRHPQRATPSSAISRARPSWCSSSIACRPSARPTPRRLSPEFPVRFASSDAPRSTSRWRRTRTDTRAPGIRMSTSTPSSRSRPPAPRTPSPRSSSTPTTISGSSSAAGRRVSRSRSSPGSCRSRRRHGCAASSS